MWVDEVLPTMIQIVSSLMGRAFRISLCGVGTCTAGDGQTAGAASTDPPTHAQTSFIRKQKNSTLCKIENWLRTILIALKEAIPTTFSMVSND
jgi:hypothetical protein